MARVLGIFVAVVVGAGAALAAGYYGLVPGLARSDSSTATGGEASGAKATATDRVVALARLEPAGGIIELGGVPGDRVVKLLVAPGRHVKKDDELLVFESRTLRQLDVDAAQSQLDEATKRLAAEQAHADALVRSAQLAVDSLALEDLELSAQRTKLQALEKGAEIARKDYERLKKLDAKITSAQELEHAGLMRDRAEIELSAAREQIAKLEAGIDLKRREAETTLAQANAARAKVEPSIPLESLRKALAAAQERLRLATLRAPCDATVLEVPADEGDAVAQMPLVRLADLNTMIARAEVYETQIAAVAAGQPVSVTADALPKAIAGTVERVGSLVGGNQLFSLDPRRTTDNRIVAVRIRLDDPVTAAQFVNLQVTATIDTSKK